MKVGDVLKARGKPTLRVVGRAPDGKRWLAERIDKFGAAFPVELATYGVRDASFPDDEATILGRRDQKATDSANRAYRRGHRESRPSRSVAAPWRPLPGSPEARFAELAESHED